MAGTNANYEERIRKEFLAEMNAKGRDPLAPTLASLVGGIPDGFGTPAAQSSLAGSSKASAVSGRASAVSGKASAVSGKASAVSGKASRVERSSRLSGASAGGAASSQLSAKQQQQTGRPADKDDKRSQLSVATSASWKTPSSIRSSEPSAIARNKIAELQCAPRPPGSASLSPFAGIDTTELIGRVRARVRLHRLRLELERVLRLQREHELEEQRREKLLSGKKSGAPAAQ